MPISTKYIKKEYLEGTNMFTHSFNQSYTDSFNQNCVENKKVCASEKMLSLMM